MEPKKLVKLSNIIGIISIILLIYWVFIFTTVEVFGLKVFRENITETFYMSILGILSLMLGALIINIMFNLTRIAQKHNNDSTWIKNKNRNIKWIYPIASFPIIFGLLFGGDYLSTKKKEGLLIQSAKSIINDHSIKTKKLLNYSFTKEWFEETKDILFILSKTDKYFPNISVIVKDSIDESQLFLEFQQYYEYVNAEDTLMPQKKNFIMETTKQERDYLNDVFDNQSQKIRFSAHDGKYQLYYPYVNDNKIIVLYFSDYITYGKIGS